MQQISLLQERAVNLRSRWMSTYKIADELGISQTKAYKLVKHINDWPKKFVNLTPHPIKCNGVTYQNSWYIRSDIEYIETWEVWGIKIFWQKIVPYEGLMVETIKWVKYIVSRLTAQSHPERDDF